MAIMSLRGTGPTTKSPLKDLLRQEVPENLEVIVAVGEQSDPVARQASRLQERYNQLRIACSEEREALAQVQQGQSSMAHGEMPVEQL